MTTITARSISETTSKGRLTAAARRAIAELIAINARRKAGGIQPLLPRSSQYDAPRQTIGLIGLSRADQLIGEARVKAANPRKQNIDSTEPGRVSHINETPFEYRGKFKGWRGSSMGYVMQSVGYISQDGKILGVIVDGRKTSISAGQGYYWAADSLGIKLVQTRSGADYHPDSAEVFDGFTAIRASLLERKAARTTKKAAPLDGLLHRLRRCEKLIGVADSLAAGNCRAGTEAFARLLGLDPRQPLPVAVLVAAVEQSADKISHDQKTRLAATLARIA